MADKSKEHVKRMIFALNDPMHDIGLDLPTLSDEEYGALVVFAGLERGVPFTSNDFPDLLTEAVCRRAREVGFISFVGEDPPFKNMCIEKSTLHRVVARVGGAPQGFVRIREMMLEDWPLLERARKSLEVNEVPEGLLIYAVDTTPPKEDVN